MTSPELAGKVALVAGGGRGIGRAISVALGEAGATVRILDRDGDNAATVGREIVDLGGRADAATVDLLDAAGVDEAIERALADLGRIDVLVNVAGGMLGQSIDPRPLFEWTQDQWDYVLGVNLSYMFRTCRAAIPSMIEAKSGAIVNIASLSGVIAAPRFAPYGAAKAGVIHLTATLAAELGQYGIRVNAVAPGTISTPVQEGNAALSTLEQGAAAVPLGRRGRPADIAEAVAFLASPRADYITGQTLVVDGGVGHRFPLPLPGADVTEAPAT